MRKTTFLYFLIPVVVAIALRLYPTVTSGMPFSTDAWSPIRNTQLLIQNTPIPLNAPIFDGYNNFWPANSIFGAILSQVTGIDVLQSMSLFFPIIGAMAIVVFFVIVRKLYNTKVAFVASTIFAVAYSHAFFTAGVTKETYASPLYMLLILMFIHPRLGKNRQIFLFTIASVALALTHHFTALITILILTSIAVGNFANKMRTGIQPALHDFLLIIIPTAVTVTYFELFAQTGMAMPLTVADWIALSSFQALALATALYTIYSRPTLTTNFRLLALAFASVAAVLIYVLLSVTTALVPGFTVTAQESTLLYVTPYFILAPFMFIGFENHKNSRTITPLFWIAPLAALEAFAIFSNSVQGMNLWIRTPDFICAPAAILAAVGIYWIAQRTTTPLRKIMKPAFAVLLIAIIALGSYGMYATVTLQKPDMGYQWLYTTQEFQAATWVNATTNQTVSGDVKVSYLLQDYFGLRVDEAGGFKYLDNQTSTQPKLLFIYSQMGQNGYVLALHGVDLPQDWTQRTDQLNQIYSNKNVKIYSGIDVP